MQEHEAWLTALLNRYLAGPANSILEAVGFKVEDPSLILGATGLQSSYSSFLFMILLFAFLRPRLSMDKPGSCST